MMSLRCDRHLVTLSADGQCSRCDGRSTPPPWLDAATVGPRMRQRSIKPMETNSDQRAYSRAV
jgi:hypothetical protein